MGVGRDPVFLVGFMGAGKGTVGRELARILGWDFVDLDELIVESEGRTITAIFEESGEAYFRRLEFRLLGTLRGRRRLVVACGGGTYAVADCRARIEETGRSVWLDVPLEVSLARCEAGGLRPRLGSPEQAAGLYRLRLPWYRKARYRVPGEGLSPAAIARRILDRLSD